MKKLKEQKAITLIALIITIIVLLILAGVTINMLTGENGIIARAQLASERQKEAKVLEEVKLILADYAIEREISEKKLFEYLEEKKDAGKIDEVTDNEDETVTVEKDKYLITIKEEDLSILSTEKTGKTGKIVFSSIIAEPGEELTATITFGDEIDVKSSKWQFKNIETEEIIYSNSFNTNPETINLTKNEIGTYSLYILLVDKEGNEIEKVSRTVIIGNSVEKITLSETNKTLELNEKITLTAITEPENASNKKIKWSSSDKNIVTVDENGVITGVGGGEATITAEATDGSGITAICIVKVEIPTGPNGKQLVSSIITTNHKTIIGEDVKGNQVVVPGEFKIASDSGETVQQGIVIEDEDGNQFVWVPVSNIDGNNSADGTEDNLVILDNGSKVEITLGRYTFSTSSPGTPILVQKGSLWEQTKNSINTTYVIDSYFYELAETNVIPSAKNLSAFISSVNTNKGYYIARYEASYESGDTFGDQTTEINYKMASKVSSVASEEAWTNTKGRLWNYMTQENASKVARNMYNTKDSESAYVESDLVNSYAWDTAIVYIQAMGNSNYANKTDGKGTLYNAGEASDEVCKINDMSGNLAEWTTEYSTNESWSSAGPCTHRSGDYSYPGSATCHRYGYYTDFAPSPLGFRSIIYSKYES